MNEVHILDLPVIENEQGRITKIFPALAKSPSAASAFQEIYISSVFTSTMKNCRLHKAMTCNLKVIAGSVIFHFFSNDRKKTHSIQLSSRDAKVLVIPPGHWFTFENTGSITAEIMNFADRLHEPEEQISEDYKKFCWE